MAHTLKELAQRALDVQGASNLTGVLHSAAADISELRELLGKGNKAADIHPITLLWAGKIASFTDASPLDTYDAWDAVEKLARGGEPNN